MKRLVLAVMIVLVSCCMFGCEKNSKEQKQDTMEVLETETSATEQPMDIEDKIQIEETEEVITPEKEDVLAMRSIVLEGMSEDEIKRLTENIKIANLQMEEAYLYDDLFTRLEDKDDLYWNYFDEKGDIQIDWEYNPDKKVICESENLTEEAFYEKYGVKVMVYNRFNADNFIALMSEMKESVKNEKLRNDIQYIIDETNLAVETHEMEHANNIYKVLHDMDYYLLRYGIEDVGKYTVDDSVVSKYYGMLSVYAD